MMRIILGIIAFLLTFGFSVTLIGLLFGLPEYNTGFSAHELRYDNSTADRIGSLIRADVNNGLARHRVAAALVRSGEETVSLYSNEKYRATVINYVDTSSSMSDAGLPRDFQYAWRQHMNAWKKQAEIIKADEGFGGSEFGGFADNTNEINQTWYQVLRIAKRYGVRVNSSYYR